MLRATDKQKERKKCRQALTANIHEEISQRSSTPLSLIMTANRRFVKIQLNIWVIKLNSSGINDFSVILVDWYFSAVAEFKHKLKVRWRSIAFV